MAMLVQNCRVSLSVAARGFIAFCTMVKKSCGQHVAEALGLLVDPCKLLQQFFFVQVHRVIVGFELRQGWVFLLRRVPPAHPSRIL